MFAHILPVLIAFLLASAVGLYTFAHESEPLKIAKNTKTDADSQIESGKSGRPASIVFKNQKLNLYKVYFGNGEYAGTLPVKEHSHAQLVDHTHN